MWDVRVAELAGRQYNRVSRAQLLALGLSRHTIDRLTRSGRLVAVEQGVFAVAPLLDHEWGRWMGATLTAPGSVLSHVSAAAAWGIWSRRRRFEVVTRPGSGGPRRHGGVIAHRSTALEGETTLLRGIPITDPERTLLDLARTQSDRAVARSLREAVRLGHTTLGSLGEALGGYRGRSGSRRLGASVARYAGLPLARARSGAEVRALQVLRSAGLEMPRLNVRIAGEEADLSWPSARLIIEIDGGPFHLDRGEDARKERAWTEAGWTVHRLSSDDVYRCPHLLLALAAANVRGAAPNAGTRDVDRVGGG